jgi:asparagine synthase (glutamine-hydrolysing)
MCGILAWFRPEGHPDDQRERFRTATRALTHRGPDGEGFHFDGPVALGHRRLSIIDLAGGAQPMFNEDRSLALVYNGEIYNFDEAREALRARGHQFETRSDTEVILHGYEEWGADCLARFNGMFAFTLWDAHRRTLWVVRDRLGVKPLYYWTDGRQFACASEIKALLQLGVVRACLNERVLDAYFSLGYVPGPETMFQGIRKLAPGHHLRVSEKGVEEDVYWDFAGVPSVPMNEREAAARLHELLRDCVRKCLVSDVPLGVFLSGGLDSSATVALMHECGVAPINTFTVGYNGRHSESEERFARTVARQFRTRHHVFTLEAEDFFHSLDTLLRQAEEPIVEPAAIALWRLSKLAREEVTVLLSGEGSDEILGGYSLYRVMDRLRRLHAVLPSAVWRALGPFGGLLPQDRQRKYLDWLSRPLEQAYQGTSAFLTPSVKRTLYTTDFLAGCGTYLTRTFAGHFERARARPDALGRMLYVDAKTWLADDLLVKADKMTMAASVELRVPFLDHRLVEFATALPPGLKCRDGEGKWLLKHALSGVLPDEIVWRRKMGFPVPVRSWFAGELLPRIEERLLDANALPWFRPEAIRRLLRRQASGTEDHSKLIMALLVAATWLDQHR